MGIINHLLLIIIMSYCAADVLQKTTNKTGSKVWFIPNLVVYSLHYFNKGITSINNYIFSLHFPESDVSE